MERKFYPENFEKFLKGHADQFKMTPSKKVWHGIYNDLHPGRRWPSIAMSIVFIFTLVTIGHLNTNNGDNSTLHDLASIQNAEVKKQGKGKTTLKQIQRSGVKSNGIPAVNDADEISGNNSDPSVTIPLLSVINNTEPAPTTKAGSSTISQVRSGEVAENKVENSPSEKIVNPVVNGGQEVVVHDNINELTNVKEELPGATNNKETDITLVENVKESTVNLPTEANTTTINKPRKPNSTSWVFYVSPSLGYRILSDRQVNNAVNHKAMMGYEGGISMGIKLLKKLKFTTGLQVNLSGYNIKATNAHPIIASLVLNGEVAGQHEVYSTISQYANKPSNEYTKLTNYSLQASLPIGLQYTFAGNENIKFNIAASIQPTYILSSKAYFLSDDKKNYLTTPDLFRKWNTNTSFATYISFSSNSFSWQIGPQVRYQLLSTYTDRYPLKEHFINYGLRIGISTISK